MTIPVGSTSATITVNITDDATYEGAETFNVNLSGASGASIADSQGVGTILDDGSGPGIDDDRPTLAVDNVTVTEGTDPYAVFTVSITNPSVEDVDVNLALNDGTATSGADFGPGMEVSTDGGVSWTPATSATIAAGSTSVLVRTPVVDDVYAEGNETFTLVATQTAGTLTNASATGTGTIQDEAAGSGDTAVISIAGPGTVTEGDTTGTYTLTLTETPATDVTVTLSYSGTATDGTDYTGVTTVTIPAGSTSQTFTIATLEDLIVEGDETIVIDIASVSGGGFEEPVTEDPAANQVTTTITDNDLPAISIDDVTVSEDAGTATFTVTLDQAPVSGPVTVNYATASGPLVGGATSGTDFTSATGVVTIPVGSTSATITVAITDDATYEGAETFNVNLSGASGASIADSQGVGTILDDGSGPGIDDDRPTLAVDNVTVTEGTDPYAVFTVSITNPSVEDVDVNLALNDGTATSGADFGPGMEVSTDGGVSWTPATSATIAAGSTSVLVRTPVVDDVYAEGNETFTLVATQTAGTLTNASATGTGTIQDEAAGSGDTAVISIAGPGTVTEGDTTGTYTLTLTETPATDVTVTLAYSGTATDGTDYTGVTTVTIPAGSTSQTFTIDDAGGSAG